MKDNDNRRKLNLIGITYNQIESGVYALILEEEGSDRRLPIIIGASEAQSIECKLQEIIPPRPLTHDLFVNVMRAYGLRLIDIDIKRIEGGIFAADLNLTDGERELSIDSRSSDAIALAIRMGVPIYTTEKVLSEVAVERTEAYSHKPMVKKHPGSISVMTDGKLEALLAEAVEKENYEEAQKIKEELDRRRRLGQSK